MTLTHSVTWLARAAALCTLAALGARAGASHDAGAVSVQIVDQRGRAFNEYPLTGPDARTYRAYLQARQGATYRIRVSNRTGERVGVVIAVDGRNIISGARSDLRPNEAMYVLEPWQTSDYRGWRTSLRNVNEFYFTEWPDSYAEAFGDRSAQGVIAMAVFRDRHWRQFADEAPYAPGVPQSRKDGAESRAQEKGGASAAVPPGTGFGDRRYDPARQVEFHAERHPSSRSFIKYEWPETLCRKGIACEDDWRGRRRNRFWPDDDRGFAPYPPSGRR